MKYVAAYLLAQLSQASPSACDVRSVLATADCVVDEAALADLMSRLHGKDAAALLAEGAELLAFGVPSEEAAAAPAPCAAVQEEAQDGDSNNDSCESDFYPLFD
eukprot:Rhum_TRINITY_DN14587_c0_g1::Rhum_TRINITY_DN14587_c0_g1_i3::g.98443::m.98443/K02943/RP-LP2, RPLP2; large subunit ribosomal protein LP2